MTRPTEFKLSRIETERGPLALVTMDNGEDWHEAERVRPRGARSRWPAAGGARGRRLGRDGADRQAVRLLRRRRHRPVLTASRRRRPREGSRVGHELFRRHRGAAVPDPGGDQRRLPRRRARDRAPLRPPHDRDARCATSPARRSSSGSSPPGAARSSSRGSPAWTPRFGSIVTNPLRQNRMLTRRGGASSGSSTRCSSRRSSSTIRSLLCCKRSPKRQVRGPAPRTRPTETCSRRPGASWTTRCTARRRRPTSPST